MCATAQEPENAGSNPDSSYDGFDAGPSGDGPKTYAPRAMRLPRAPGPSTSSFTPEPPRAQPPWKLPGQPGAFASDAPTAQPLGQIAPKKLVVVEQSASAPRARTFGARELFIGAALIAGGLGGYMASNALRVTAPDQLSSVAEPDHAIVANALVAARAATTAPAPAPRLVVDAVRDWQADEPVPLGISYTDEDSTASVVINGLAPGSTMWGGVQASANAWRLATTELKYAVIKPPRGFVGVMRLSLELRLADNTVADRKSLQLEWTARSTPTPMASNSKGASSPVASTPVASAEPAQRHLGASDITLLVKRGAEMMTNGNIGAARMLFRPAAEAGDQAAAFALAETYDPSVLEKLGAKGITSDTVLAQHWYERARALGSTAAPDRLATFTH
jgi:hypothetical protein